MRFPSSIAAIFGIYLFQNVLALPYPEDAGKTESAPVAATVATGVPDKSEVTGKVAAVVADAGHIPDVEGKHEDRGLIDGLLGGLHVGNLGFGGNQDAVLVHTQVNGPAGRGAQGVVAVSRDSAGGRFAHGVKDGAKVAFGSTAGLGDLLSSLLGAKGNKVSGGKTLLDPIFDSLLPGVVGTLGGGVIDLVGDVTGAQNLLKAPAGLAGLGLGLGGGLKVLEAKAGHDLIKTGAVLLGLEQLLGMKNEGQDVEDIRKQAFTISGAANAKNQILINLGSSTVDLRQYIGQLMTAVAVSESEEEKKSLKQELEMLLLIASSNDVVSVGNPRDNKKKHRGQHDGSSVLHSNVDLNQIIAKFLTKIAGATSETERQGLDQQLQVLLKLQNPADLLNKVVVSNPDESQNPAGGNAGSGNAGGDLNIHLIEQAKVDLNSNIASILGQISAATSDDERDQLQQTLQSQILQTAGNAGGGINQKIKHTLHGGGNVGGNIQGLLNGVANSNVQVIRIPFRLNGDASAGNQDSLDTIESLKNVVSGASQSIGDGKLAELTSLLQGASNLEVNGDLSGLLKKIQDLGFNAGITNVNTNGENGNLNGKLEIKINGVRQG